MMSKSILKQISERNEAIEILKDYLLSYEDDIAYGIDGFGCLRKPFIYFYDREPSKDADND